MCAGLAIEAGGAIGVGVSEVISNVIDFFSGASPEQTAANNAVFVDVGDIVGDTALAPIVLGTGILGAEIMTNFVLTNPIVSTEIAGGILGTLIAPDATEPTTSFAGKAAGFFTGIALNVADTFFKRPSPTAGASGGFVLYPSKPNTNQIRSVYEK